MHATSSTYPPLKEAGSGHETKYVYIRVPRLSRARDRVMELMASYW